MPWEDLRPALSAARGASVAVDTPVTLLGRMGFFEGVAVERRVLLYGSARRIGGAARAVARAGFQACPMSVGSLAGLPFPRRSIGLVVAPFPPAAHPDVLRMIRRTAGIISEDGILVLHGPLRRSLTGWSRHVASVLGRGRGGLPVEWDVTAWMLRGGFNRIMRYAAGRASPVTILLGTKNLA